MSNITVKSENKKEFKDFITLLSSEICKEILNKDLKNFNCDMQNNQAEYKKTINSLATKIYELEKNIPIIQHLTSVIKAYESEIKNTNQLSTKAFNHVQNTEQQLISSIEKKNNDFFKVLQTECKNINSSVSASIKSELPKQKLKEISEYSLSNKNKIKELNEKIEGLVLLNKKQNEENINVFNTFEHKYNYSMYVSNKHTTFLLVLMVMCLLLCAGMGYVFFKNFI